MCSKCSKIPDPQLSIELSAPPEVAFFVFWEEPKYMERCGENDASHDDNRNMGLQKKIEIWISQNTSSSKNASQCRSFFATQLAPVQSINAHHLSGPS